MKKYLSIIAVAAMAAYATSALAQGRVGFANSSTSLVQMWADSTGSTLQSVPKGAGYVQLAYAPAGTTYTAWAGTTASAWIAANPGWTLGPSTAINPVAGRFNGGEISLTGVAAGASADFVVLGWAGAASSFDAAFAAGDMLNVSGKFTIATPSDPLVPSTSLATAGFTGLTLQPIPEPSVFALAGLGAAALLIFRRRK